MHNPASSMSNFERLSKNVSFMSMRTFHSVAQFRNHPQLPDICIEYIKMAHRVAEATVPLMHEVIRCAKLRPNDPVTEPLIAYMEQHIKEETNHDEWYVNDLAALGVSRDEIFQQIPSPNLAAMIGSQYYWIKHHHPVAFMGYMSSLEVYPPTIEYVEQLIRDSKLPEAGFDTLMMHARIDIKHRQDIIDVLNALPLTEAQFGMIEMSAFQSFRYLALIMDDVCRTAPEPVAVTA